MKKIFIFFLALIVLFVMQLPLNPLQAQANKIAPTCIVVDPGVTILRTTTSTVVRAGAPGAVGHNIVMGTLARHTTLTQRPGTSEINGWINVSTSVGNGWVLRSNLELAPGFC